MPQIDPKKDKDSPAPYNDMEIDQQEAIRHCVESAGRALVVLSGGDGTYPTDVAMSARLIASARFASIYSVARLSRHFDSPATRGRCADASPGLPPNNRSVMARLIPSA